MSGSEAKALVRGLKKGALGFLIGFGIAVIGQLDGRLYGHGEQSPEEQASFDRMDRIEALTGAVTGAIGFLIGYYGREY